MEITAAVVAAGDLAPEDADAIRRADLVVAADAGADALARLDIRPHVIVGDLDSVTPALVQRLEASGTRVERHPTDKEASDTELAVEHARAAGARQVTVYGAIGGERLDHELANVLLITDPAYAGTVGVVRGTSRMHALHGGERRVLGGAAGDHVSLLPVGDEARGVTTEGLRWALADATLPRGRSRGLSNEILRTPASVAVGAGTLLVVETAGGTDR